MNLISTSRTSLVVVTDREFFSSLADINTKNSKFYFLCFTVYRFRRIQNHVKHLKIEHITKIATLNRYIISQKGPSCLWGFRMHHWVYKQLSAHSCIHSMYKQLSAYSCISSMYKQLSAYSCTASMYKNILGNTSTA